MLDMAKLQICGDRLKKCLETDTPIHAFVPKPVPYSGPYVTTEMRERWAKLDHDFAMLRTTTSLIYTEEGMVEVVKATQDKLEMIEAVLVEKDLSENSKSTKKRTWDEYQTQTQGQVEELLSRKRSRVGEMKRPWTTFGWIIDVAVGRRVAHQLLKLTQAMGALIILTQKNHSPVGVGKGGVGCKIVFQNWCGNNSSGLWHTGFIGPDAGTLTEFSLHIVCAYPPAPPELCFRAWQNVFVLTA
eukprot:Em0001g2746a